MIPWNKGLTKDDPRVMAYSLKRALKMTGRKHSPEHKNRISIALKGMVKTDIHLSNISKALKGKPNYKGRGENQHLWKGGVTPENEKIRHSIEYDLWRYSVLSRDKWICQECGSNQKLNAHHVKSFSKYPELRFAIDNGKTLCKPCHIEAHKNV